MFNRREQLPPSADLLISRERQTFYRHIYSQMERLLPQGKAKLVLTAALGSSIKDILLTVPLDDQSVIVAYDNGPFISAKPENASGQYPPKQAKQAYQQKCQREHYGASFFRSGYYGIFDANGYGKRDLITWELEDLGVKRSHIDIRQTDARTWAVSFPFRKRQVTLFFIEVSTRDHQVTSPILQKLITTQGIDVVVAKGDDGAFDDRGFTDFVRQRLSPRAVLLSDSTRTLTPHDFNSVPLDMVIQQDIQQGIVFGYPTDPQALYRMDDGVPLSIKQRKLASL